MAQRMNLAELSDEALTHKLLDVERALVTARFRHSLNTLDNTSTLGGMKKDIARIKTEARRREIAQGLGKDALIRSHRSSYQPSADAGAEADSSGGFLQGIVDKIGEGD